MFATPASDLLDAHRGRRTVVATARARDAHQDGTRTAGPSRRTVDDVRVEEDHALRQRLPKALAEAPPSVEYAMVRTPRGYRVVDIVTEGSSLAKNYYDRFRKMMDDPNKGYPNVVKQLRDKVGGTVPI